MRELIWLARYKNALTKYYVGDLEEQEANLRLAKWIETVEDDSDEEVEDSAFYDKPTVALSSD